MGVYEVVRNLTGEENWVRNPTITFWRYRVRVELFYNSAVVMAFALIMCNAALWLEIVMMLTICGDNTCSILSIVSGLIYGAIAVMFAVFIGALVYNTIWRCLSVPVTVILALVLQFSGPIAFIVGTMSIIALPACLCFAYAMQYVETAPPEGE